MVLLDITKNIWPNAFICISASISGLPTRYKHTYLAAFVLGASFVQSTYVEVLP